MDAIIGKKLKIFREANRFTQEQVAVFVGMERGTLSNYELGTREVPVDVLVRLSNLYGVELSSFLEEDKENMADSLLCCFRMDNLTEQDIKIIAEFKAVVKSYLKMSSLETE